jgi:zinc transporter ZupT
VTPTFILNTAGIIVLALIHLFGRKFLIKKVSPLAWLSFAGGTSVAYVFVHILPELADDQVILSEYFGVTFLEHHAYLVALFGLIVFYGLEKAFRYTKRKNISPAERKDAFERFFWFYIGSYVLYNALIGYLLVNREDDTVMGLLFYTIAMGFHFLVNDFSLNAQFKKLYEEKGRIVLALGVIAGWFLGNVIEFHEAELAILRGFISGGIILGVLKEELPEEKRSKFWAFAGGAAIYSVLLLLLD